MFPNFLRPKTGEKNSQEVVQMQKTTLLFQVRFHFIKFFQLAKASAILVAIIITFGMTRMPSPGTFDDFFDIIKLRFPA